MKRRRLAPQLQLRGGDFRKPSFLRKAISCVASAVLATMMIPAAAFASNDASSASSDTVAVTLTPNETYTVTASTPYKDGAINQGSLGVDTNVASVTSFSSIATTSDTPATSLTSGSSYKLQDQRSNGVAAPVKRWLQAETTTAKANGADQLTWYKEGDLSSAAVFTLEGSDESGWSIKGEADSKYLNSTFAGSADGANYFVGNATFSDNEADSSFKVKAVGNQNGAYNVSPQSGACTDYYLASYCGVQRAIFQKNGSSKDAGGWWNFYETAYNTSVTLTAQSVGTTSFVLGGKTYDITVADANAVEDVYVGEGQTISIASDIDSGASKLEGTLSASNDGAEVTATSKLSVASSASASIENGKSYLVKDLRNGDSRWLTANTAVARGNGIDYTWFTESSQDEAELFTPAGDASNGWSMYATGAKQYIDTALGEPKVSSNNGSRYNACDVKLAGNAPSSPLAIKQVSGQNAAFTISASANNETYYLNSYCGQTRALFLDGSTGGASTGGQWSFYEAGYNTTLTATGKTAGAETEIKVGATVYRVHTIPTAHVPLNASAKINASGTSVQVTGDVASYVTATSDNGVVTLSNDGANVPAVGETKTGYLEIDNEKVCSVEISLDGEYSIAQGGSIELTNNSGDVIVPDDAGTVIDVNTAKDVADLVTEASGIESGKQYIIAGARIGRAMTNEEIDWSASNAAQGLKHNSAALTYSGDSSTRLVTASLANARMTFVDAGNGKFKIQTVDGKWLKSDGYLKLGFASTESDATAFSISKFNGADASKYAGSLQLSNSSLCISDWGGNPTTSKGMTLSYTNPGAALYIYEVKDVVASVMGKAQGGPVYINVGNKSYGITVGAAAASINGKSYTTVSAAAKAAKAGDTIEVNDSAANENVEIPADVAVEYEKKTFAPVAYKVDDNLTVKTQRVDNGSYLFLPSNVKSISKGFSSFAGMPKTAQLTVTGNEKAGSTVDASLSWTPKEGLTFTKCFKTMFSDNVKTLALDGLGHDISWLNENKSNAATEGTAALIDADGNTATASISKLKGRGNTSWAASTDKKPYNLTLAKGEKLNLVGDDCNAERKWSLIANNTGDYTGVCNDFAYELYQKINGDAAVHCAPVNLYVAGEYRGVYLAVDKVELGKNRVNITEPSYGSEGAGTQRIICEDYKDHFTDSEQLKANAQWKNAMSGNPTVTGKKGNSTDPAINAGVLAYSYVKDSKLKDGKDGGILIEVAHQYTDENCWFITNHGVMISLKEPDCATQEQVQRIAMYVQDFEDALYSETGLNSKGKSVADYADLDSIAKTFILSAFTGQNDFLDCSDYFYVDFGGNGEVKSKMHAGPAWDYNSLAMSEKTLYQHKANQTGYNGRQVWIEQLLKNGDFTAALYKLQKGDFATVLAGAASIATSYNEFVKNSVSMDQVVWKYVGINSQNEWASNWANSIATRINAWNGIWSDTTSALRGITLSENNGALQAEATGAVDYKWYKVDSYDSTKGTEIDGATGSVYTPAEAGIYYAVASGAVLSGTEATAMRSNPVVFGTAAVTFDGNGQVISIPVQDVVYQGNVTKPTDPTATGYAFGGWFKDQSCTQEWDFDKDTVEVATTLYAKWIPNKYTVTFNANGHGTAPVAMANVEYNTTITAPASPSASSYTFGGWYKDAACTQAWDFATDKVTGDTTLYAKWTYTGGSYVPTPSPDPTPTPDPDQPSTPDTPQAPAKGDVVTAGTGTGQLTFTVTAAADASGKGGTVSFTGCNGSATSVDVPATVEVGGVSYAVTEIAPYAFKGAPKLERVTMAGSIARVGKGAFESCKRLESVAVGTGVKYIGKSVFKGCKRLKTVTVTSRHLTKKKVAGCLKGSSVKTVVVKVGAPKANKSYAKKYAKVFTKKICGKKVAVKASKKTLKK